MGRRKISEGLRREVFEQCGPKCAYCGQRAETYGWRRDVRGRYRVYVEGFQWDHLVPVSRGGDNDIDNMVMACESCNKRKGTGGPPWIHPPQPIALPPESTEYVVKDDYQAFHAMA